MTKKQQAALYRMINREASSIKQNRKKGDPVIGEIAGVHPMHEKYVVTDWCGAVIFPDMPSELPEANRDDELYDKIHEYTDGYDRLFALTVTSAHVSQWRQLRKSDRVAPVRITAHDLDGKMVEGLYNPSYLIDVVEAIGIGCTVYIGHNAIHNSHAHTLFVYPKNSKGTDSETVGVVLPVIKRY